VETRNSASAGHGKKSSRRESNTRGADAVHGFLQNRASALAETGRGAAGRDAPCHTRFPPRCARFSFTLSFGGRARPARPPGSPPRTSFCTARSRGARPSSPFLADAPALHGFSLGALRRRRLTFWRGPSCRQSAPARAGTARQAVLGLPSALAFCFAREVEVGRTRGASHRERVSRGACHSHSGTAAQPRQPSRLHRT